MAHFIFIAAIVAPTATLAGRLSAMMDPSDFAKLSTECIDRVIEWVERFDPDEVDFDSADGVVTLEFADGKKFVLNRQAGSHQMWLAADARAWHYDWDAEGAYWRDSRDEHELYGQIAAVVSAKLGREVAEV
ncbi:MAG: iron donor protein CyaY [Planctomycetes bacterium]|nr:iron donor protein CyaY [Planctomycetota bacterium]MDP6423794.1 iron donor protein CyaY [Planctomycetota bacterium]